MKSVLLLCLLFSTTAFSQDKEKISTGHRDIISSVVTDIGECKSNSKDLVRQVAAAFDGQRTTISVESSVSYKVDQVVRMYDMKKTKTDGEKKEEMINVKEVEKRGIVKTKTFSVSVALYKTKYSKKKEAYVSKKRDGLTVVAEAMASVASLDDDCESFRANY